QADTVAQARGMPRETPALPQACFVSDPFFRRRKRQRPKRGYVNVQSNSNFKGKSKKRGVCQKIMQFPQVLQAA
ncbi:MAG: hypothetical protein WBG17_08355, partial [Burkholderiaceae bacterium]